MRKKRGFCCCGILGAVILLGALFLGGCAPAEESAEVEPDAAEPVPQEEVDMREDRPLEEDDPADEQVAEEHRYVIEEGELTLLVEELEEAVEEIQDKTAAFGGYVSSMDLYGLEREQRAGQVVVRVPQERFDEAVAGFEELGDSRDKKITTDDVTREYIDMEARIANLKSQEERFRELLEEAGDIEEVLQVEEQLGRVRGDLEAKQARFKNLQEQVNYSIITVNLEEKDPREKKVVGDRDNIVERIASLFALNMNRLISALSGIAVFLLGTLPITLPLIGLALGGWKLGKFYKRRKHNSV